MPTGLSEGALEIEAEFKVRVPDLAPVRVLLTGAVDGTEVTPEVPYGTFAMDFHMDSGQLSLSAGRVAWTTEEPEADPKGGPGELTLKGRCYGPDAATLFDATVVNDQPSY